MKIATMFLMGALALGAAACDDDDSEVSSTPSQHGAPVTYVPTEEWEAACATYERAVFEAGPRNTPPPYIIVPEGSDAGESSDCPLRTVTPEQP